jgi:outer membrane protein assembly factor BamB
MVRGLKRLLVLVILIYAALRVPLAQAGGGWVLRPYWTFNTESPVTQVQAGDIDGDGAKDIVVVTADKWVRVLENDGDLLWGYETLFEPTGMLVDDLDGDGRTEEIILFGEGQETLLSHSERPVWTYAADPGDSFNVETAVDLNGDGRLEVVGGTSTGVVYGYDPWTNRTLRTRSVGTQEQAITGVWVGDIDGDARPEIVPSLAGGHFVFALEDDFSLAWAKRIEGEVGLAQGGDVDGDGQAEVVSLTTSWQLSLFESDGSQVWEDESLSARKGSGAPVPGQLIVHDLDSDGRAEIVVTTPAPSAAVRVFDGDAGRIWEHPLDALSTTARLKADDINGDGKAELVVTTEEQPQVYLLDAEGRHLAEYRTQGTTGALDYVDLNGDGWGEVIVGTQSGVQVFAASDQVVRRELWQSPRLGFMAALLLTDLEGDGQGEVLAGSTEGRVYALSDEGRLLWKVDLEEPVWALSAGDVDGDGQREIVAGTWDPMQLRGGGQVHLLEADRLEWSVEIGGGIVNGVALSDLDGDGGAEIIVGSGQSDGQIALLEGTGAIIWRREFDAPVTAVGAEGGTVLAGTQAGRVYRLAADGLSIGKYDLGAKVLSLDAGRAVTADGKFYHLADGGPALFHELGEPVHTAQLSADWVVTRTREQEIGLVGSDGLVCKEALDSPAFKIAVGDLNSDGEIEIAVSTEERVHLLGLALNQPPLITEPSLVDTRTGYAYSVDVNDPDGDAVAVTLEIWDPSAGVWLEQPVGSLAKGQFQGRLAWDVPEPFDTWDSGRESRFRFRYGDGSVEGITQSIAGPSAVPTVPWYLFYGRWVGLGVLVLLIVALNLMFYRRQRAHRLASVVQAEMLPRELRTDPDQAKIGRP